MILTLRHLQQDFKHLYYLTRKNEKSIGYFEKKNSKLRDRINILPKNFAGILLGYIEAFPANLVKIKKIKGQKCHFRSN